MAACTLSLIHIFVWGANTENSAINQGDPNKRVKAIENGLKVIDIRPMLEGLGSKADVWLPIRPGTDCALALACLNVIIGEDLYDHEFTDNWCNGFDKLAEHVVQYLSLIHICAGERRQGSVALRGGVPS